MRVYYGTDNGKIRVNNEDNFVVKDAEDFLLCVIADGMGGHNAGEIASKLAVETINSCFSDLLVQDEIKIPKFIIESLSYANTVIHNKASMESDFLGMGCTLIIVVIDKKEMTAYVGNVGDSRAYLIKDNNIRQITEDHTVARELYRKGEISDAQEKTHSERHVLTRALGAEANVSVDIFEVEFKYDDKILLCSDGLSNLISENDMLYYINRFGKDCVYKLIELANENGGTDNITVIVADSSNRGEN